MYLYSQLARGDANRGSSFPENFGILLSQGIDHSSDYPQGDYDYTTQPTSAEVTAAAPYRVTSGTSLFRGASGANQAAVEASFAAGHPVLLTIPVYDNFAFANATHAFVDVPTAGMTNYGGHGVFAAKYDTAGVWIENQWGTSWGNQGWAELSWAFVNQYAEEGWYMTADGGGLSAPSNVTATGISSSQIKLTWSGVSGATGYRVKRLERRDLADNRGQSLNSRDLIYRRRARGKFAALLQRLRLQWLCRELRTLRLRDDLDWVRPATRRANQQRRNPCVEQLDPVHLDGQLER